MTKKPFQGTGTAMVTPFKDDGSVDEKALRRFVDFQIDGLVDMLLPCGTTGEGATLDTDETDAAVSGNSQRRRGQGSVGKSRTDHGNHQRRPESFSSPLGR